MKEKKEILIKGSKVYKDERGNISNYELPEKINWIGLITSKSETMRANHYHPKQEQKVLLIKGKFISVFKDLSSDNLPIRHQLVQAGDLSVMPSNVAHAMIFLEDSIFVNLVNGDREHEKFGQHTIKYELVKSEEINYYISKYKKYGK